MTTAEKKPVKQAAKKSPMEPDVNHPSTLVMIREAIGKMGGTKGASLYAIKKYILDVYKLDNARTVPLIRKTLKKAVEDKTLIQLKGTGASGSFKLPVEKKGKSTAKKAAAPKKQKETASAPASQGKPAVEQKNKPDVQKDKATAATKKDKNSETKKKTVKTTKSAAKAKLVAPADQKKLEELSIKRKRSRVELQH